MTRLASVIQAEGISSESTPSRTYSSDPKISARNGETVQAQQEGSTFWCTTARSPARAQQRQIQPGYVDVQACTAPSPPTGGSLVRIAARPADRCAAL